MTSSDLLPPPPLTLAGVTSGTAKKKDAEAGRDNFEARKAH